MKGPVMGPLGGKADVAALESAKSGFDFGVA